ncbi:KUP system potassium uptake protein [Raineyella antarctica]|uniref:Probable potassium transport system protein Kup n=1 Tax=Raineyella antarctica TaxID=1577474 RepID=A0A1G6GRB6_9ACTN|nr:potassium transporter Kup [Raineyella antarctica]SDB84504.1 KUP system potassium uptake protein [Raineyella antarctica]
MRENDTRPSPQPPGPASTGAADGTHVEASGHAGTPAAGLAFAALGVVFGDIGTSPLYAMQTVFATHHNDVQPVPEDVFGVISMVLWAITIVVSFKYITLVMRADNEGEGGILSLTHLLRNTVSSTRRMAVVTALGMTGAALFFGDSVITPAISVMSAVEGLTVVSPMFETWVVPAAVVILSGLFFVQKWGTAAVGRWFGPVMAVWFVTLALLGLPHIISHPAILGAVSPHHAILFIVSHPFIAFIAVGAVVLTITGAEALYADMGHFGKGPIRMSWFAVVFPALALNYFGQGAMILEDPATVGNPFFNMAPDWATLPLVGLATIATVIASQAVISGAFSVARQSVRMGLFPRLLVRHTSKLEGGQIYVPVVNWILFFGVLTLIGVFRSSANLASAYGLAVTGTLILESLLFLSLAHMVWKVQTWKIVVYIVLVLGVELAFFSANLAKLVSGGWLPLTIATAVLMVMTTWRKGAGLVAKHRRELEGPLDEFVEALRDSDIPRVPGVAVYAHPNSETTPLALRSNVYFNHVVHQHVVLIEIVNENVPHIRHVDRVHVQDLGFEDDGIVHISVHVGFSDSQDIPRGLALAIGRSPELDIDPDEAHYFLSVLTLHPTGDAKMSRWRKMFFVLMANNAASRTEVFHLPPDRTAVMGAEMEI